MIQNVKLPAGTTVLAERFETTKTVSIGLWYLSGSRDEVPQEVGCAATAQAMRGDGVNLDVEAGHSPLEPTGEAAVGRLGDLHFARRVCNAVA